jgi:hypothetical protein
MRERSRARMVLPRPNENGRPSLAARRRSVNRYDGASEDRPKVSVFAEAAKGTVRVPSAATL